MLGDRLPGHVEPLTQRRQRLPALGRESIQQLPPRGIRQGLEDLVPIGHGVNMQEYLLACQDGRKWASVVVLEVPSAVSRQPSAVGHQARAETPHPERSEGSLRLKADG